MHRVLNNKRRNFLATILLACTALTSSAKSETPDVIAARGGSIRITPKFHASFQIEYGGKVIVVDPVMAASWTKKADMVLITHGHADHCDRNAILKVSKPRTQIIMPTLVSAQFRPWRNVVAMSNSDRYAPATSIAVEAVSMYNLVRGPKAGQKFHPKGDGNGYVLTLGNKRIYIAGDTEATPEMKALKNIDVAFLPMNLPFTMTPQEAANGARAFKPKIVFPYHYRYPFDKANNNPQQFQAALKDTNIQIRLRNWYPPAAVANAVRAANRKS